jgi:heme/copper-type cytochrome/quinol oxidase subunit 2
MANLPLNYASKNAADVSAARPGRSAGKWLILLVVWLVGLIVWVVYIAMMIYVFFKYAV